MTEIPKEYEIKKPSGAESIFLISIIILILLFDIYRQDVKSYLYYIELALIIIGIIGLIIILMRTLKKPSEILFYQNSIEVNEKLINIEEIETFMIYGYFRKIVGIKLKGNFIVPSDLSFQFVNEQGIDFLKVWSRKNNVKFINKFFVRWI